MLKRIYICHTVYHLFITLCKDEEDIIIILVDTIPNAEFLKNHLSYKLQLEIYIVSNAERTFTAFELRDHNIYIYNDDTNLGRYLRKKKYVHNVIEESYNYFSYSYSKPIEGQKLKWWLKTILYPERIAFGYSKFAKSIEINDLQQIVSNDCRKNKFIEVPRKTLLGGLSSIRKNQIAEVFNIQKLSMTDKKKMLVLTQPLFQDNWDYEVVTSEQEQINFYRAIVDQYSSRYSIYFKIHPRDEVDYGSIKDVVFLDKNVPMELYEFIGDYFFDVGVTHSSTALESISCVEKKIFLKNLRG